MGMIMFTGEVKKSDKINGVIEIKNDSFFDARGEIWSPYQQSFFNKNSDLPLLFFNHDKIAISKRNVLRGIHGDFNTWKLVTCLTGSIIQVVVDLRLASPSFGQSELYNFAGHDRVSLLLPPGVGNAFYVTSISAIYSYKLSYEGEYTDSAEQFTIIWNDKTLSVKWPDNIKPFLSERDKNSGTLEDYIQLFS